MLPLIFISFYTWSHIVSLCFEAISTKWGKQISRSIKSHLGIFKQNIRDKLKVLIHIRAGSHAACHSPGCITVSEIVPAVLTAFALAWSMGKALPFPPPWMAALLHSWAWAAFLPLERRCSQPPAVWSVRSIWVAHASDHGWRRTADLVYKSFFLTSEQAHIGSCGPPLVTHRARRVRAGLLPARLWVCCSRFAGW